MLLNVDLTARLTHDEYVRDLGRYQVALRELCLELYRRQRSMVVVYEGWDAAGKGSNIRRVTEKLDPRGYEVHSIAAPSGEERTHHYLWRFWRRLRPASEKQLLIFDRSWYGRVLVERVEAFCAEADWRRAYSEINGFERQLAEAGTITVKFWLHISKDEQLNRFEERRRTPYKQWKLTGEDWRNREKWEAYEAAADEMLIKTSTRAAPWRVIEGNDKCHARVKTVRILVETLASELDFRIADDGSHLQLLSGKGGAKGQRSPARIRAKSA